MITRYHNLSKDELYKWIRMALEKRLDEEAIFELLEEIAQRMERTL